MGCYNYTVGADLFIYPFYLFGFSCLFCLHPPCTHTDCSQYIYVDGNLQTVRKMNNDKENGKEVFI